MTEFMGQSLPELRSGKVYCMEIYPGGRKSVRQINPELLHSKDDAIKRLRDGRLCRVLLGDAVAVLSSWWKVA